MKTIENPIIKTSFKNEFGEIMYLTMDQDYTIWFHHDDCNDTYEDFKTMGITIEIPNTNKKKKTPIRYNGFKYVLDDMERKVLVSFIKTCREIAKENNKKIELTWWDKLSYAN
jgi:glycerol-3-phosphate cytidylyltransferase-like family protein